MIADGVTGDTSLTAQGKIISESGGSSFNVLVPPSRWQRLGQGVARVSGVRGDTEGLSQTFQTSLIKLGQVFD